MITKNIYTVRVLDVGDLPDLHKEKTGKLNWITIVQKDAQWSAEAVLPDFSVTDRFDLDVIFEDEFRKTNDVNAGDRLMLSFGRFAGKECMREAQVLGIRKDKPINHLQNKS
jgi:hypothetical protein